MTTPGAPPPDDDLLGSLLSGRDPGADGPRGTGDPHAGHAHAQGATADVSVRPAIPEDAPLLAAIQVRCWRAVLADVLPAESLAALDPESFAASWHAAITAAPSREHRVLTACAGADVVGFVAFAPAELTATPQATGTDPAARAPAGTDAPTSGAPAEASPADVHGAEIVALEVDPDHARAGHGSRLLAACADTVREIGGAALRTWARDGDEARVRFLSSAGFAPAGLRRTLDVPGARGDLVEIAWHTSL